jgi:hypothetical protein
MPTPDPVTVPLGHYAPVWLSPRAGLAERLALDPLSTPVSVRGVDPREMSFRAVPVNLERTVQAYAFEGRLWRPVVRKAPGDGAHRQDMEDGFAVLSGEDGPHAGPMAPYLPEHHRSKAYPGTHPIPPRALSRAGSAYHDASTARARLAAERDLVHDGTRFLAAMDMPLLAMRKGSVCFLNWRTDPRRWHPTFPHDRPDLALAQFEAGGYAKEHVEENRASKLAIAKRLAEALHGFPSGNDNLRHLMNAAPFFLLEACADPEVMQKPLSAQDVASLKEMAALGAIDAAPLDYARRIPVIRRACESVKTGGGGGKEGADIRHLNFALERYCMMVAVPQLADGPMPDEDIGHLGGLVP